MSLKFLEEEFNKIIKQNERFGKWEKEFYSRTTKGKILSLTLFAKIQKTPIDWNTLWIVSSIGTFTLNNNVENFEYTLNQAINRKIIKSFERKKLGYKIIMLDSTLIRFMKLTDFIPSLEDDVKNRLHSNKRSGHCHWDSIDLSRNLELPNKIVSGYCTMQSKNMPYPHTWVEIEHQGKEWIIDFTMNEVMNKEGYYKLHNPQNTISIDNKTLIEDMKLRSKTSFEEKDVRMYLFHPNETREEMKKEISNNKSSQDQEFPWILKLK